MMCNGLRQNPRAMTIPPYNTGVTKGDPMNGWKNYSTWNVSLWVQNDEFMYKLARNCGQRWDILAGMLSAVNAETPDGVRWDDPELDVPRLNEMLSDM